MSEGTAASLVRMINQIATNFAALGEAAAIAETAEHIRRFWDPRMRATLQSVDRNELGAIARGAVDRLVDMPEAERSEGS